MQRAAFQMHLNDGAEQAYEEAHRLLPDESLAFMNEVFYMQGQGSCGSTQEEVAHAAQV